MEGRLSKSICDKISSLDISKPYVWQLRLSELEFTELEAYLSAIVSHGGVSILADKENAITTIVYLAEWYKRRYQSGNKNTLTGNLDLETLWNNSGISKHLYLYHDDNGNCRWQYSIFVLGGLAIQHELNRNDKMKFLKGLCRIYHGENYTLENLDEASRAIAFCESIKRKHSLYDYLKEILNGEMPFHSDDLKNQSSDVNRFVSIIKSANDEILRVKFRFEWAVNFSPDYNSMTRRLNIWFKPEEVGGELHQYLRYDRVHLWGMPNPEKQKQLYVYIRFKNGDTVVEPSTIDSPIITYVNHSVNDFVAFGVEKGVQIKNVPTSRFDKIEIFVKDDAGKEYLAQSQASTEYIQLWRQEAYSQAWTSTQNAQKETALLFSNRCQLKNETLADDVYRKPFRDEKYGKSESWNWIYIYDSVTFVDDKGKTISLYNRVGYDQITTRLYSDTIHYVGGGKVKHYYIDDPDISDDYDIDELPLIFGLDDVIVRHFATKDDILNARPEEDTVAELIEFKLDNGRYAQWTPAEEPPFGEVTLRVTVKGIQLSLPVIYLPRLSEEQPIMRDFEQTLIRYRAADMNEATYQDEIPMDGNVLSPTVPIKFGEGDSYYEVDVYRPTLIKEVMLDGKIINYLQADEKLRLPYIFKNRVQLNDFSIKGYQAYECKNLCSIYSQTYLDIEHNPSVGMAALAMWNKDTNYAGKLLDAMAPESLLVCFGRSANDADWNNQEAFVWNYDKGNEPTVSSHKDAPEFGIVFQNLSKNIDLTCNYPVQVDDDPWGFDDVEVSIVKCFEVANVYQTYFFLMKPLVELTKDDVVKELYEPLIDARGGQLTDKDKQGLRRFGEEFGLDWRKYNINIETE